LLLLSLVRFAFLKEERRREKGEEGEEREEEHSLPSSLYLSASLCLSPSMSQGYEE